MLYVHSLITELPVSWPLYGLILRTRSYHETNISCTLTCVRGDMYDSDVLLLHIDLVSLFSICKTSIVVAPVLCSQ